MGAIVGTSHPALDRVAALLSSPTPRYGSPSRAPHRPPVRRSLGHRRRDEDEHDGEHAERDGQRQADDAGDAGAPSATAPIRAGPPAG